MQVCVDVQVCKSQTKGVRHSGVTVDSKMTGIANTRGQGRAMTQRSAKDNRSDLGYTAGSRCVSKMQ